MLEGRVSWGAIGRTPFLPNVVGVVGLYHLLNIANKNVITLQYSDPSV